MILVLLREETDLKKSKNILLVRDVGQNVLFRNSRLCRIEIAV